MSSDESESVLLDKGPCDDCGSSDACATYSDGHTHCFSCGAHHGGDGTSTTKRERRPVAGLPLIPAGDFTALVKRKLSEETCRKWGYTVGEFSTKDDESDEWTKRKVQIAAYRDDNGQTIAQHVRFPDKTFMVRGEKEAMGLWGKWLWRDRGKMIVVTEGQIDAMTVSQLQGNKWPVVSVSGGADNAAKCVAADLEYLLGFDTVIFMLDNDEAKVNKKTGETRFPGQEAAKECAALLPPGRAKIAALPLKDPSDMLMAGRGSEVIDAIWGAKEFKPDGILNAADLWEQVEKEEAFWSIAFPWARVQEETLGMREGEVIVLTAGSGIGKSAVVREIAHHALGLGHTVGMLMLEETVKRTALGMTGLALNHPLHLNRDGVSPEAIKAAFDSTLGTGRLFLYDHFGSTAAENLFSKIRYMAVGCKCKVIILDHLSIVVSGSEEDDERKLIDNIMTRLATLAVELKIVLIVVSHLKRPSGDKGHEEGANTSLSQLRGSHAIAQLGHTVIGLERNQQGDHPNVTMLRILKCRWTGNTGPAGWLEYSKTTGRLTECDEPSDACPTPNTSGSANDEF